MRGALSLVLAFLMGCGPSTEDMESIRFAPLSGGDLEEYTSDLFERMFFQGHWEFVPHLVDFPLH